MKLKRGSHPNYNVFTYFFSHFKLKYLRILDRFTIMNHTNFKILVDVNRLQILEIYQRIYKSWQYFILPYDKSLLGRSVQIGTT